MLSNFFLQRSVPLLKLWLVPMHAMWQCGNDRSDSGDEWPWHYGVLGRRAERTA